MRSRAQIPFPFPFDCLPRKLGAFPPNLRGDASLYVRNKATELLYIIIRLKYFSFYDRPQPPANS